MARSRRARSAVKFCTDPSCTALFLVVTTAARSCGPSASTAAAATRFATTVGSWRGIVRSIRITTSRPSCAPPTALVTTSGGVSIAQTAGLDGAGAAISIGVKARIGVATPLIRTVKSASVSPRTGRRLSSRTVTSS